MTVRLLAGVAVLLTAAGCSGEPAANTAAADSGAVAETQTSVGGVTREEVATPTPAPTQAPIAAIQTQPGPKGSTVALTRAAVTGDILTVALSYQGGSCCAYTKVDEVSVIDDATSQRLGVLKDNAGKPMAAPLYNNGKEVRIDLDEKTPTQIWFKFPAPPVTSATVSITIPEVAPFDAVPVTR
jgi:hypothetical protein